MKKLLLLPTLLVSVLVFTTTKAFANFGAKGPFGGSVSCSDVFDTTVYIGTFTGGVFRSSNAQLTAWQSISVGLKSGKISSLTHSATYLFAGTVDSGVYIFNGYVGTEKYWIKINKGLTNLKIKSLLAIDSVTILAGTDGGGLFKTTDRGNSWIAVNSASLNNTAVTALTKVGDKVIAMTFFGGLFSSNDKGNTWLSFNDTRSATTGYNTGMSYNSVTDELAILNRDGICSATDASKTTMPNYYSMQSILPAGIKITSVSNNGKYWIIASNSGVYISTVGSINWQSVNSGLTTSDVTNVIATKSNFLAGTYKEGIFISDTTKIIWKNNNNGFNNLATYAMETGGDLVVIVATENGIFVSRDLAATYTSANNGLTDSLNVTSLKFVGTLLYASTKNAGVFVSADTGRTWKSSITGLTNLNIKKIFASNTNWYVLDSTGNLFQLSGLTWASIQSGLPTGVVPTSMCFYGTKTLLGTYGQGIFMKETSGGTWAPINSGLSNFNITSVTSNGTKLFAGTDGSSVFIADIVAPNWKQTGVTSTTFSATMGLDGTKIQDMAYNAGYIFASYKGGLLATSDGGKTWIDGGNQFNLPSFADINKINFTTTYVFVSTPTNGIYSNALSELPTIISDVNDISPALNAAIEISPNPSTGIFNIFLKDVDAKINEIIIYNISGKEVQHISNIFLKSVDMTINNFSPGIYFVRINTDRGIAVEKVVFE